MGFFGKACSLLAELGLAMIGSMVNLTLGELLCQTASQLLSNIFVQLNQDNGHKPNALKNTSLRAI